METAMMTDALLADRTVLLQPPGTRQGTSPARRYDLDWLRVFAFGMLIFYHVGMFYVTWDWHVKSRYASHLVEPAMGLINPWRLALLFFISGVAIRFATDKTTLGKFLPERFVRLFAPLVFGMAVICMPQAYAELRFKGEIGPGFFAFYREYLGFGDFSIIVPTWNHLWYLAYMLVYTLIATACLPLLRSLADGWAARLFAWLESGRAWRLLIVPAIPFVVYRLALDPLFPTTHTLWGDWANIAHTLTIFLLGFVAAKNEDFWRSVDKALPAALGLSIALGVAVLAARLNVETVRAHEELRLAAGVVRVFYAWSIIMTLLGLARRFANRTSPTLTYLTAAIFPYYILHQTIVVIVGYWFTMHEAPVAIESVTIIAATILGSVLSYEIIRRAAVLRPLFGLPMRKKHIFRRRCEN
jgi:glucans biosynthesis protein C